MNINLFRFEMGGDFFCENTTNSTSNKNNSFLFLFDYSLYWRIYCHNLRLEDVSYKNYSSPVRLIE